LQPNDQDAAVARYERRKVVVATNVAETASRLIGVRLVIDAGWRVSRAMSEPGINTLLIEKISQAKCGPANGRAGRTAPANAWAMVRPEHG